MTSACSTVKWRINNYKNTSIYEFRQILTTTNTYASNMFTERSSNSSIDPSKLGLECQVRPNQILKIIKKIKDESFIENIEPSPYWQQLLLQPSTYAFGIYALLGFLVISISGLSVFF